MRITYDDNLGLARDLGIPTLQLSHQALELPTPVVKWGVIARTRPMPGTYHFYMDDYKFSALPRRPHRLPSVGCAAAVEVNFSTQSYSPLSQVVYDVYRKRDLARQWQSFGIKIMVDLSVEPRFREHNYLGVPLGWQSYAVRAQKGIDWDTIVADHARAVEHADGKPVVFAVFGGGGETAARCQDAGWIHVPEHVHVAEGRVRPYGSR